MPNSLSEAEASVMEKLGELRTKAENLYGIDIRPEVLFNLRGQVYTIYFSRITLGI